MSENTETSVSFEYKLEVSSVQQSGSSQVVLDQIDSMIVSNLQFKLPNGESLNPMNEPSVVFKSVNSQIYSECFAQSDECALVRSTVLVSYEGVRSQDALHIVTLHMAKQFLEDYDRNHENVSVKYMFPKVVTTLIDLELSGAVTTMKETDVGVLESTFLQVFGAILFAIEGDTDITSAQYIYQQQLSDSLTTQLRINGVCRTCTSDTFGATVGVIVTSNLDHFTEELQKNTNGIGSSVFDNVKDITYSVPEPPEELPNIEDEKIFDNAPPQVSHAQPWFLWTGIALAVIILAIAIYIVKKDNEAFEKGEETSDSSDSESGEGFTNDGLSLNPFGNNENSDDLFLENILSMATDCQ